MRSFKIQHIFILMIIVIILLSLIILLFENQTKFYPEKYIQLQKKLNISNNESIVFCNNYNEFIIITPYDFYICGNINPNIRIKQ